MAIQTANTTDRPAGMRESEIGIICELVAKNRFSEILEIGMANGSSSTAILSTIQPAGGNLVSIDPYQLVPANQGGYAGGGVKNVENAGLAHLHTLLPEPDYIALPKLVEQGKKFDFIFIDGYHAFDYTFIDFFYADLLLRKGGILAFHDTAFPAVHKVCRFIAANKSYDVVGPPAEVMYNDFSQKLFRRLRYLITGQSHVFRERRLKWCSVAAFQKVAHIQSPEFQIQEF